DGNSTRTDLIHPERHGAGSLHAHGSHPGRGRRVHRARHPFAARRPDPPGRCGARLAHGAARPRPHARHAEPAHAPSRGGHPLRHAALQHPLRLEQQPRLRRQCHPPELQQLGAELAERDRGTARGGRL
ncbi:MAG: hypothetical protein AVDCRST_MAG04-3584, partial [uncultured Acetobacteraceae bacterium]